MTGNMNEVITKIKDFFETNLSGSYEIYDLQVKSEKKRPVIQLLIDSPNGITIRDCENVSKAISRFLDEIDPIHFPYTLEVSSPGVERLMRRHVDYERHIGKMIKWTLKGQEDCEKMVFLGRLQKFSPEKITVLQENGIKEFTLDDVIEARAVFEFPKKLRG